MNKWPMNYLRIDGAVIKTENDNSYCHLTKAN